MSPTLRTGIALLLCTAGFAQAADPPSDGIDLGAIKLRKAGTPATTAAAPAAAPAPSNAVAPRAGTVLQNKTTVAPASAVSAPQAAAPAAPAPQAAAAPAAAPPPQTGIGTVVGTAPIGKRSASDILGQSQNQQQQSSSDLQVKMPSMFKKVNP
jgi:hypothetical protein